MKAITSDDGKKALAADYLSAVVGYKVHGLPTDEKLTTLVYRTDGECVDAALQLLRQGGLSTERYLDVVNGSPLFDVNKLLVQERLGAFILDHLENWDVLEKIDAPLNLESSSGYPLSAQLVTPLLRSMGHQITKGFKVGFSFSSGAPLA